MVWFTDASSSSSSLLLLCSATSSLFCCIVVVLLHRRCRFVVAIHILLRRGCCGCRRSARFDGNAMQCNVIRKADEYRIHVPGWGSKCRKAFGVDSLIAVSSAFHCLRTTSHVCVLSQSKPTVALNQRSKRSGRRFHVFMCSLLHVIPQANIKDRGAFASCCVIALALSSWRFHAEHTWRANLSESAITGTPGRRSVGSLGAHGAYRML